MDPKEQESTMAGVKLPYDKLMAFNKGIQIANFCSERAWQLHAEGHSPECSVNMAYDDAPCTCSLESINPKEYFTEEEWKDLEELAASLAEAYYRN